MSLDLSTCWTRCEVRSDVEHTKKVEVTAPHRLAMPMRAFEIPRFIPHTKPTPPDQTDTTGRDFIRIRMNPTPPDQSDRLHRSYNPSVAGSIHTRINEVHYSGSRPDRFRREIVQRTGATPRVVEVLDVVDDGDRVID